MVPHHGSYRSGFRPLKTTCLLGEIPAGIDLHRALADPWGSLHEASPPNRGIFPTRCSTRSSALSSIGALPLRRLAGVQAARPRPRAASGPSGSLPQWTSTAHTSREWQIARSSGRPRSTQSRRCQLPDQRTEQLLRCCGGSQGAATIRPRRVPHSSSALNWVPSRGTEHGRLRLAALKPSTTTAQPQIARCRSRCMLQCAWTKPRRNRGTTEWGGRFLIRGCSTPALRKRRRENEDEKKNRAFGLDLQTTATVEGEPDTDDKKTDIRPLKLHSTRRRAFT